MLINETKCTCNSCGKIWYFSKKDEDAYKAAVLNNVSNALMCCGGCWPALFMPDKQVKNPRKCPNCNSENVTFENVNHDL